MADNSASWSQREAGFRVTDSIGYMIRRAQKLIFAQLEQAFVGEDLNFTQWIALMHLRDGLAESSGALARCLDHDSGAITRMIDQLEARGLVARRRGTADRRVIHLELTEDGCRTANRHLPRLADLWETFLADFAPTERAALSDMLRRLIGRLETIAAAGDMA